MKLVASTASLASTDNIWLLFRKQLKLPGVKDLTSSQVHKETEVMKQDHLERTADSVGLLTDASFIVLTVFFERCWLITF